MCLLVHRLKGATAIPLGWLMDFWKRNDDGFGAWWIAPDGHSIIVRKTLVKEEAEAIVREVEAGDFEAGFHWRMATHGAIDETNIHPFALTKGENGALTSVVGHNGVLSHWTPENDKGKGYAAREKWEGPNDTAIFADRCLRPMVRAYGIKAIFQPAENSPGRDLLEMAIGGSNRLLLTGVKLGFNRVGDSWVDWRGMKMSNTYAWSYSSREKEAGPEAAIPFYYSETPWTEEDGGYPIPYWRGSQRGMGRFSSSTVEIGSRPSANATANGSAKPDMQSPISTAEPDQRSLFSLCNHPVMVRCPPDAEMPCWHWKYTNGKYVDPAVLRDPVAGPALAAEARKLDGEVKPDVDFTVGAQITVPHTKGELPRGADGRFRKRTLTESDFRDIQAELLALSNVTDDIVIQTLENLKFEDLARWCQQEPEEAALLLQSAIWEGKIGRA